MENKTKDLAVIILNYNGSDDTIECIKSLDKQKTVFHYSVYILDNGSQSEIFKKLEDYIGQRKDYESCKYSPDLDLLAERNYLIRSDENFGFAKGNNQITKLVMNKFEFVVLLNNDTTVDELFIDKMLQFLNANPDIKYASCRINNYFKKDLLWNCGGKVLWWGNKHYFTEQELARKGHIVETSFISGCALYLRTDMLSDNGLLSEDFFHGEEDFNFCWRMKKAGIRGACLNETLVYHKISVSSKKGGMKVGKVAGYYANRIIDMHKFYPGWIWEIWRRLLMLFIVVDGMRKKYAISEIKEILRLVNKYSYNTQLTYVDCKEMGRF